MTAADFIHDTTFNDLPAAAIHEAIRCLVDTLGVGVAASKKSLFLRSFTITHFVSLVDRVPRFGKMNVP